MRFLKSGAFLVVLASLLTATAAQARFLQTDPVGYKDGPDWYLYVGDDPLNHADPTGTEGVGSWNNGQCIDKCRPATPASGGVGGTVEAHSGGGAVVGGAHGSVGGSTMVISDGKGNSQLVTMATYSGTARAGVIGAKGDDHTISVRPGEERGANTNPNQAPVLAGLHAGAGGGPSVTNATQPSQLLGPGRAQTIDTPVGSASLATTGPGGKVWTVTLSAGPGTPTVMYRDEPTMTVPVSGNFKGP